MGKVPGATLARELTDLAGAPHAQAKGDQCAKQDPPVSLMQEHIHEIRGRLMGEPFLGHSAGISSARCHSYGVVSRKRCESHGTFHARGGETERPPTESQAPDSEHTKCYAPKHT